MNEKQQQNKRVCLFESWASRALVEKKEITLDRNLAQCLQQLIIQRLSSSSSSLLMLLSMKSWKQINNKN